MASALVDLAPQVRVARGSDRVYRDECVFCFDSPFSPDGIYTNLATLLSYCAAHLPSTLPKAVYLHHQHTRVAKPEKEGEDNTPSKLAIGGEGGFAVGADAKFDVLKRHELVVIANGQIESPAVPLDAADVPARIQESVHALLNHAGNTVVEEVSAWQEELKETKYAAGLIQLPDTPKISSNPASWQCQAPSCDKQENLWLNLSDGYIGCGRKNWDGSGGCGAALDHYKATGEMYPLAVKLGTITAEGGDVYSYAPDEDDVVLNPQLAQHLVHFGINMNSMKKTDKSLNELQVGLNLSYEFDAITESGKSLTPISGAGYIGFKNLGNSCYMNSVLQLIFALPELKSRYFEAAETIFCTCNENPADDFSAQMAKLARAILSDRYKKTQDEEKDAALELRPSTFRTLVGKGHADFSTGQQQDAVEYFQYLLEIMTRNERVASGRIGPLVNGGDEKLAQLPTASLFKFKFEDRVECLASHKVKYVPRDDSMLQLQIPLEAATNATQVQEYQVLEQKRQRLADGGESTAAPGKDEGEKIIPNVPFQACIEKTLAPELLEDFLSSATGKKGPAQKLVRFKTFPRYLLVQMRRYYAGEDWTPKKLDVIVNVPETLSLSRFLGTGLSAGEELLPEDPVSSTGSTASPASVTPDEALVAQLVSMGFSENGCKRAAVATGNSNAEAAMEWIFSHMEDSDFNDPLVDSAATATASDDSFNMDQVEMLTGMGFSETQVKCALRQTDRNPDRAAEWLFSHMDDLDAAVAMCESESAAASAGNSTDDSSTHLDTTSGEYSLVGFVSHIGKNTNSGHYVCHLKKDGKWIIFNDDKVALSEEPPFGSGYLYLFRRNDVPA